MEQGPFFDLFFSGENEVTFKDDIGAGDIYKWTVIGANDIGAGCRNIFFAFHFYANKGKPIK